MEIKAELHSLRSGRGIYAPDLTARLGPYLRELCGVATTGSLPNTDPAALRQRLITELNGCARHMPPDMATAIRVSLGLHADASDPQFGHRVSWLAEHIDREVRTAVRRIDDAETLMAEQINQELERRRASPQTGGWHLARFEVLVRLDGTPVEVYEERSIVADRDGLDEITIGVNLPGGDRADLRTEVRHGARLIRRERPLPHRIQLVLALPIALRAGDVHPCGLVTRFSDDPPTMPHFVITATRPIDEFHLTIRWPTDRLPRWVRRVSGEPVRLLDSPRPTGELLTINPVGEVHTEFTHPTLHLAYGVQFWPPAGEN